MPHTDKTKNYTENQLISAFFENKGKADIVTDIVKNFKRIMTYYRCAIKEVRTKFEVLDEEYSMVHSRNPIVSIHSRLKNAMSIIEKMQRKHIDMSLEDMEEKLSDIAGLRIVCPFIADVYNLERSLLEQDDIELIKRKDYIKEPKSNGYRSLHLVVSIPVFLSEGKRIMKVEVQIRTLAMDSWATLEHQLKYKKGFALTRETENELFMCSHLSNELDERMDNLRMRIINKSGF